MACVVALCVVPAAAQKITSDYDKETNFSTLKTYAWAQGAAASNPTLDLYIKSAIDMDLEARGLHKAYSKDADLLVLYNAAGDSDVNSTTFQDPTYTASGGQPPVGSTMWSSGSSAGSVGRYIKKGSLAIEMYDRHNSKIVWAAAAKVNIKEKRTEKLDQLDQVLTKMMALYPPKK